MHASKKFTQYFLVKEEMPVINSQLKDATIKLFLKEKDSRLIRLINSIRNTNYPEDLKISENTLETPVFMAAHNDFN